MKFNSILISTGITNEIIDGGNSGIRIAKRVKRTCGGEPVTCTCCCGIGFRCGFTSLSEEGGEDERVLASHFEINPEAGTFIVKVY